MDEAIANAMEAVAFCIEGLLDAGEKIPYPHGVGTHAGMIWALVSVDLASRSGKSKRLNISLPERVLRRIDSAAEMNGETRSGFIARIALERV